MAATETKDSTSDQKQILNEKAAGYRALHAKYKKDDAARDLAVSAHRAENPPANAAAEAIVIYELRPPSESNEREEQ